MRSAHDFPVLGQQHSFRRAGLAPSPARAGAVPQGRLGLSGSAKGIAGKRHAELRGFWEKGSSFSVILAVSLSVRPTCGMGSVLRILQSGLRPCLSCWPHSGDFAHCAVSVYRRVARALLEKRWSEVSSRRRLPLAFRCWLRQKSLFHQPSGTAGVPGETQRFACSLAAVTGQSSGLSWAQNIALPALTLGTRSLS